jgi:hypothetical protein
MDPTRSPRAYTDSQKAPTVTPSAMDVKLNVDTEERVCEPNPNDVLCGRGGSINSHGGNENFRKLVEKRKRVYLTARFKREKRLIASSIVTEIRNMNPSGRFLAKTAGKDGPWYDIGDEKARDKTSQALRENAPTIRAEIEVEINAQIKERKQDEELDQEEERKQNPTAYPPPPPPAGYYPPHWGEYYYSYYYGHARPPPPPPHLAHLAPPPPPPHLAHLAPPPHLAHLAPPPPPHLAHASHSAHAPPQPPYPYPPPPAGAYWGVPPTSSTSPQEATSRPTSHEEFKDEPPAGAYWGVPPTSSNSSREAASRPTSHEEFKEEPTEDIDLSSSQEDKDHRLAMDLQHQEHVENFEVRKRNYQADPQTMRNGFSGSFVTVGRPAPRPYREHYNDKPCKMQKTESAFAAMKVDDSKKPLTQEELDHRLAVALQDKEDSEVRRRVEASADTSRRTSRSNAFSQVQRVNRGAFMGYETSAFGQTANYVSSVVPSSVLAWTKASVSFGGHSSTSEQDSKPAYKQVPQKISEQSGQRVVPSGRAMGYSPINLPRDEVDSIIAEVDNHNQVQHSVNQGSDEHNSSLLSQVANHILGTLGSSWDTNAVYKPDTGDSSSTGFSRPTPDRQRSTRNNNNSGAISKVDPEGQEVGIMDFRDESSMPPPEPRADIDWPSRVGSCHTWMLPETIGAGAAALFGTNGGTNGGGSSTNTRGSFTNFQNFGISPVNSLEMDASATASHSSVGGGSLCQVFDKDPNSIGHEETGMHSPMHYGIIHQVPSWERSMRSKSPLSMGSEEDDSHLIDARMDKFERMGNGGHQHHPHPLMTPICDDERSEPELGDDGMDCEWEE